MIVVGPIWFSWHAAIHVYCMDSNDGRCSVTCRQVSMQLSDLGLISPLAHTRAALRSPLRDDSCLTQTCTTGHTSVEKHSCIVSYSSCISLTCKGFCGVILMHAQVGELLEECFELQDWIYAKVFTPLISATYFKSISYMVINFVCTWRWKQITESLVCMHLSVRSNFSSFVWSTWPVL